MVGFGVVPLAQDLASLSPEGATPSNSPRLQPWEPVHTPEEPWKGDTTHAVRRLNICYPRLCFDAATAFC
jgi:hypothetical protein